MKTALAFIITLMDDPASVKAAQKCIQSIKDTKSPITPVIFPAIGPDEANDKASEYGLEYTYPKGVKRQEQGLILSPYETKDIRKRIGCFMSHYILWKNIVETVNPLDFVIILEQDALFTDRFDLEYFEDSIDWNFICSLNSPIGATRKARVFDRMLKEAYEEENTEITLTLEDEEEEESELDEQNTPQEYKHFETPRIVTGKHTKLINTKLKQGNK